MAEMTIFACDGCENAATKRRPVKPYKLTSGPQDDNGLDPEDTLTFDAHDHECARRFLSKQNKAARDATKAAKTAAAASTKTTKPKN